MIEEILSGEQLKFSDRNGEDSLEEIKEEMKFDRDTRECDNEIAIVSEFTLDNPHFEPHREQKIASLTKEKNKIKNTIYQKTSKFRDTSQKEATPRTQKKKRSGKTSFRAIEPKSCAKRESAKQSTAPSSSKKSSFVQTNTTKVKSTLDSTSERFIHNFYCLAGDIKNKQKVFEQFKCTGKGGIIELEGDPIFSLKATLDFLLTTYNGCVFMISSARLKDCPQKYQSPIRRAFKESKNIDNGARNAGSLKIIQVEGRVNRGCEAIGSFRHEFEIKNSLISKLFVSA